METLGPCATGPRLTKPQDTAADLLTQAGSKSSGLACAESRKEIRPTMLSSLQMCYQGRPRELRGRWEPGHLLKHLLPPPASQEKLQSQYTGCVWDITGPLPFQTNDGGILSSFAQSFVPLFIIPTDYVSVKRGEIPMPIRRDYFRGNMKVTSCPQRHKSCTSMDTAERWTGVQPGSR